MEDTNQSTKRIAKNTLLLYVRMLFLMLISLYTSRVILNALGVEDYGVYNVVGGFVTMFSMLSNSLHSAIGRFITYELGTGNRDRLCKIFSTSISIQVGLSLAILLLAETIGLWFVNSKMVIPETRIVAANWCYQFSLVTFCINLISVPYNAAIIAHEKMSAFAYISILEAIGKLIIAWCIVINPIDRLIYFAAMVALLSWIIRMIYAWYCKIHFEECSYHFIYDHHLLKQMFGFAGWSFIGGASYVMREQGGNIILNLFFGPAVNAARAISVRVNSAITGFVSNFMTALNPQITKSYACGDSEYMFHLIFKGARYGYYILFLLSLPVIINTHYILVIWLKLVPEHTVFFVQLTLIFAMSECISNPLITAMLATGKIRNYQIVVGGLQMTNLPIAYLCLYYGCAPESVIIVAIVISQCCLAARLYMLRNLIKLKVLQYIKQVYLNVILISIIASVLPIYIAQSMKETLSTFIITSMIAALCTVISELYIGCTQRERHFIYAQIKKGFNKFQKRDDKYC